MFMNIEIYQQVIVRYISILIRSCLDPVKLWLPRSGQTNINPLQFDDFSIVILKMCQWVVPSEMSKDYNFMKISINNL